MAVKFYVHKISVFPICHHISGGLAVRERERGGRKREKEEGRERKEEEKRTCRLLPLKRQWGNLHLLIKQPNKSKKRKKWSKKRNQ